MGNVRHKVVYQPWNYSLKLVSDRVKQPVFTQIQTHVRERIRNHSQNPARVYGTMV